MHNLQFQLKLTLQFDSDVTAHRFTMRCLPGDTGRQRVCRVHWQLSPEGTVSTGADTFGRLLYGCVTQPHQELCVQVDGMVETTNLPEEPTAPDWQLGPYRMQTPLTMAGPLVNSLDEKLPNELAGYDRAIAVMQLLHQHFTYAPGTTNTSTTAEEAVEKGCGVCQDYAHVMLAMLRLHRIPCRYAVGLMAGEGASHAWVEVPKDGFWVGLDPTNHRVVGKEYIRLSVGRDANDCPLNRGLFSGWVNQQGNTTVKVWNAEE